MNAEEIQTALQRARTSLVSGSGLEGTGFWKAVRRIRADRVLAQRFAAEVGEIDAEAFSAAVRLKIPAGFGVAVLCTGTAAGIVLLVAADRMQGVLADLFFLGGFGGLLVSTHSLAHWVVGRAMGMRFTHFFLGGPPPPRPGAKVDYSTYLLVAPRKRALFHASGAVVTKILPFALIPFAVVAGVSRWVALALAAIGVLQLVTDALFSIKSSDWKKFIREMKASRRAKGWG
ncbi:MAG: hypothetical protein KY429_06285 [Actinobacteria bacterium]|nr:hypothetical protein [Actinomycetota bacterium]